GLSTREPTRNDLFQGEDNATIPHDLHAVRPERVLDIEAGWDYRTHNATIAANGYAMEFRNEIAATGELSDIGLPLRRNVDRSYRRGLELDATWRPVASWRVKGNANVSRNRIDEWTQFYDVYDAAGEWAGSRSVDYRNVAPLLTPEAIVNTSVDYAPGTRFSVGAIGRWVASSFLDNTNNNAFRTPSYFVLGA